MATNFIQEEYLLDEATEDRRVSQSVTRPGFWSRLTGVDGRLNGSVKPFPGFTYFHRLGKVDSSGEEYRTTAVHSLWPVTFNVGASDVWHGFVARVTIGGVVKVVFDWYDGSAWDTITVEDGSDSDSTLTATSKMDVVAIGRLIYVFRDGREPYLLYVNSSNAMVLLTDTGPGPKPAAPAIFTQAVQPAQVDNPAVPLQAGKYAFLYQFVDSVTGRVSGISTIKAATDDATDSGVEESSQVVDMTTDAYVRIRVNLVEAGVFSGTTFTGKWDQIRVYRSIRTEDAGGAVQGAIYFLEGQFSIDSISDPYVEDDGGYVFSYWYSLPDLALTNQEVYGNASQFLEDMPFGFAAIEQEGTLFISSTAQQGQDATAVSEIRWSSPIETSPELFPPGPVNRRRLGSAGSAPLLYRRAGPVIVGASRNEIYLILKLGANVEVLRAHRGIGAVSNRAATSFENSVYMVSGHGLVRLSSRGEIEPLHALDRLLIQDWRAAYDAIEVCHDPIFGAVFILNPTKNAMAVLWSNTQKVTSLEQVAFEACGVGVNPLDSNTDQERAIFALANGSLFHPDESPATSTDPEDHDFYNQAMLYYPSDIGGGFFFLSGVFIADSEVSGARELVRWGDDPAPYLDVNLGSVSGTVEETQDALVGMPFAFLDGPFAPRCGYIRSAVQQSGTTYRLFISTLDNGDTFEPTTAAEGTNTRVLINPVVMRLRGWPLGTPTPEEGVRDLTRLRVLQNIGAVFTGLSYATLNYTGEAAKDLLNFWASVYLGNSETPLLEARPQDYKGNDVVGITDNVNPYGARVKASGNILVPEITVFAGGFSFEALAMLVTYNMQAVEARR